MGDQEVHLQCRGIEMNRWDRSIHRRGFNILMQWGECHRFLKVENYFTGINIKCNMRFNSLRRIIDFWSLLFYIKDQKVHQLQYLGIMVMPQVVAQQRQMVQVQVQLSVEVGLSYFLISNIFSISIQFNFKHFLQICIISIFSSCSFGYY